MQSLDSFAHSFEFDKARIEATMPGDFVKYDPIKKKSSRIDLASSLGIIRKSKRRTPEKAIYEFLSLDIWNQLLNKYSSINDLQFRAPKPVGFVDLDSDTPGVLMEFLNGYEFRKLCKLRRTTPVQIKGQKTPIPLYPVCALHLGALNRLKEIEGLYHSDYDERHIIISPTENVSIGVVDVENSRKALPEFVLAESEKAKKAFERITSSPKDLEALQSWYQQGEESLKVLITPYLDKLVEEVSGNYGISLDFTNMILNTHRLRSPNLV